MKTPEKIYISPSIRTEIAYYSRILIGNPTFNICPRYGNEIEYVRADIHEAEIEQLRAQIQSLKIHVAELRKEKSRYEFLRERASDEEWPEWCTWEMLGEAEGDEWDALIDRLMDEY